MGKGLCKRRLNIGVTCRSDCSVLFFRKTSPLHANVDVLLIFSEKPTASVVERSQYDDNRIELICSATGNPLPVVSWQKKDSDGQFVSLEGSDGEWVLGRNVIDVELSEEHYGTYRCMAKNTQGDDYRDHLLSKGALFVGQLAISDYCNFLIILNVKYELCSLCIHNLVSKVS